MRINIYNGALSGDHYIDQLTSMLADEYIQQGHYVTTWSLRDYDVTHCRGCMECWTHSPGICSINDPALELITSLIRSDVQVHVTPITFGGFSSEIKKVLDRCTGLVLPLFTTENGYTSQKVRYDRYPVIRAVGVLHEADEVQEDIFRRLVARVSSALNAPNHSVDVVYRPATPIISVPPVPKLQRIAI